EQRRHVRAALGVVGARPDLQGRGVDDREVELRVAGAEFVEQVEGLVDDPRRAAPGPVDLVDHHDGLQALGERLARHEACLRHRSLDRIDQQQHAVHHDSTRSTSPPKSACPGVSTMLMRVPPYSMAQFLARMVMPRSRSMSLESMMRSPSRSWAAKVPDCFSRQSTSVVLPWSTCAMMAMLRIGRFMAGWPASAGGLGPAGERSLKRVRRVADSPAGRLVLRPTGRAPAGSGLRWAD